MANRNSVYDEEKEALYDDPEQLDREFYQAVSDVSVEEEKAMEKAAEDGAAEDAAQQEVGGVKDFYEHVNKLSDDERKRFFSNSEEPRTVGGRVKMALTSNAKRKWILGGIGASALGTVASLLLNVLPFQLPFVANLFDTEIGGVRDVVLQSRTGRLYSRMFFFDQDGKFDGYKTRGMVATLTGKNIRSNRFINDLKEKGFEIDPQMDANGRWTGRFNSIQGVDTTVDSSTSFLQEWRQIRSARKAIKDFVNENYDPGVTAWRSRAIRAAYSRYGLNYFRGQFIKDYAGRKLNGLAEKVRFSKIRSRANDVDVRVSPDDEIVRDDGDPDTPEERTTYGGNLGEEAAARKAEVLDGKTGSIVTDLDSADDIAAKSAGSLSRTISIFGKIEGLCHIKRLMVAVETGARTLKRLDLIEFAKMFGAMAHIVKPGDVPTAQDYGDFIIGMAKINPGTGRDFFGSGAYGYASGTNNGKVKAYQQARYSTGGGALGALGQANDVVNAGVDPSTCDFVNHPAVQIISIVGGLVAMAFSAGSFTLANAGTQVGIEIAIQAAEMVFVPLLVEMLAGTIITGDEFGDEIAAAWVAGLGGLLVVGGGIYGMGSITKDQYAVLNQEKERMIAEKNRHRSFTDRFFSMSDHRSLMANISISTHVAKTQGLGGTLGSILTNPLGIMYGSLGKLPFSAQTFAAAGPSDQCKDEDIVNNDLAADPFCNPIMGLGVDTLAVDPVDNIAWMIDNGYADEDGNPTNDEYQEYVDQCVNVLDPLHSTASEFGYEFTPMCYAGTEVAMADGTVRPMTEEEIAARKDFNPTMDDLYAYLGVEIESDKGKAYAANAGDAAEIFENPTLTQRFQAFTLDKSLLSDVEEHYNGVTNEELQAVKAAPIGGGADGGFDPGSGALPPGVPNRPCNNPISVTPSTQNLRSLVEGSPPGTCIRFTNGTYRGIDAFKPVANMVLEGESRDLVIFDGGGGLENAFSGTNPDVTIRNMTFTNYMAGGSTVQENSPIRGKNNVWDLNLASGWVIDTVHSHGNAAAGVFMGDNFFVVRSEFNNNGVTGIGGDRFEGGLIQGNKIYDNAKNAAGGALANGAGIKVTFVDGTTTRLLIADNEIYGQSGGMWCDWACNGVNVETNNIHDHTTFGVFFELSRDAIIKGNTVTNSSTWASWTGPFSNGCIATGETQDVVIEANNVSGCVGSIVVRETVRPYPGEGVISASVQADFTRILGPAPWVGKNITVRGNNVNGGGVGHAVDTPAIGRTQLSTVHFEGNNYTGGVTYWWNQQNMSYSSWQGVHTQD